MAKDAKKNTPEEAASISIIQAIKICGRILSCAWQVRPWSVISFFAGATLEIVSSLGSIYATAKLAALLAKFATSGQTDGIWFWLIVDIIAVMLIGLSFLTMQFSKRMIFFGLVRWNVNSFLQALNSMDIADYYDNKVRNQLNKVSSAYIWQIPSLSDSCFELLYGILRFAAITAVVAQITWWIVPLIAIFLIPSLLGESRLARMQWFVWDSKGDFRHVFWGLQSIVLRAKGQMELRSTQASKFVMKKVDQMNSVFYREQEGQYKSASRLLIPTKLLEVAGVAIGSIVLLRQFLGHAISLDRYFFLSGALLRIGGALNNIFSTLSHMQESLLFAHSYFGLIDTKPAITDSSTAKQLSDKEIPTIVFKDVTFVYPGQDSPVFENLNLEIKPGEHVALVGENGAGKSTLIKLLLRFYKPTSGQVLINGHDLNDVAIDTWYSQLATLFQEFNQYPLTIAENIEIGRSDEKADHKRLLQAGKFGGIDTIVSKYKHGWDTVLDSSFEKGIEPSGGQWQRVALARAFYRGANMIILDEPTSAIDAKAEYDIFNNIFEHYQNKSALIVSHRFSTVRRADRILVLDKGKILEQGSHAELMKKNGIYHDLFTKQAEGYR